MGVYNRSTSQHLSTQAPKDAPVCPQSVEVNEKTQPDMPVLLKLLAESQGDTGLSNVKSTFTLISSAHL